MMELKVDGISGARRLIDERWPTHIISIVNDAGGDFGPTTIELVHDDHHIFKFHDVENDQISEYVAPTRNDLVNILGYAKDLKEGSRLLVHCTAGKSRSTAAAIGILIDNGMGVQEAFDWMKEHRPAMFPNRLMIEYVDDILDLKGELIAVVKKYYEEKLLLFPKLVEINRGGYNR